MPHCLIEHSSNIDSDELISLVHEGAVKSELFDPTGSDIKVRALPFSSYKTGSVNISFIHVTLKILSGRTVKQKTMLTHSILKLLNTMLISECSISVEVLDIDRASYAKVVV